MVDIGFTADIPWVYTNNHPLVIDYSALIEDLAQGFEGDNGITTLGDLADMIHFDGTHFGADMDFQEQHESDWLDGLPHNSLYQMTMEAEEQVFGSRGIDAGGVHFDPGPGPVDHHHVDDSQPLDDHVYPEGYMFPMDDPEASTNSDHVSRGNGSPPEP